MKDSKYYDLLFSQFKTKSNVLTELINLEAILNLPKGTEHYMSDIHGEAEAFEHILRSGAGNVKEKIRDLFGRSWSSQEMVRLSLLIYYPKAGLAEALSQLPEAEHHEWYHQTIVALVELVKYCAAKYTRSKLRKTLPQNFVYMIEELIYNDATINEKKNYYHVLIKKQIDLNQAQYLIIALAKTIPRLVVDHLHIVGDIFDRGADPDEVMDILVDYHSLDIQWGNHDLLWLGAYCGSKACLVTLLRIAARYDYLYKVEHTYGLNLRPLFLFADQMYAPNEKFTPKKSEKDRVDDEESLIGLEKVHQALAVMQFKLEGQIIKRRPEFEMADRLLLEKIDFLNNRILLDGVWHDLVGSCFQTVDHNNPYQLTDKEAQVLDVLMKSFQNSEKMQRHMKLLLRSGSMYLVYNQHLLFHGCIPLTEAGEFLPLVLNGKSFKGKALLERLEYHIRQSAKYPEREADFHTDVVWYVWSGKKSPLFGKEKMATFERYFIADQRQHLEGQNPYYLLREKEAVCLKILSEFGLEAKHSCIINGHTPIKVCKGETPVKADGKLIVIDGGLSKAYQQSTGIGGYTLLNNSFGFQIVTHQPFISVDHLFATMEDNISLKSIIDKKSKRTYIKDTTIGQKLKEQSYDLEQLLIYLD